MEADNISKRTLEKLADLEASSSRLNSELSQQLSHLRSEAEHKTKTISSLETNLENVSSHLSHTRAQLDELTHASMAKSETISELKTQIAQLSLEIEKNKVGLESFSRQVNEKSESIASLQKELEKRRKEEESLESSLKAKNESLSELERRFAEAQSSLESAKAENRNHQVTIRERETRIFELGAKIEFEIRKVGETSDEAANLQKRINEIKSELDKERMERVRVEEKFRVTVNSLVIMIEGKTLFKNIAFITSTNMCSKDIYKRLQWEIESNKEEQLSPDLTVYWERPPQRDVMKDMETRKAKIDEVIRRIATSRSEHKTEMDSKLMDVTRLLEAEKLARTSVEVMKRNELNTDLLNKYYRARKQHLSSKKRLAGFRYRKWETNSQNAAVKRYI